MHNDHDMARRTIKNFDSKYKSFIKMLKAIIAQNKENQVKIVQLSSEDTLLIFMNN
jgi:DNA-directed RNA polymerase